jgi:5-(carboxyamino)imidazole ribonucleotide synthase
VLEWLTEHTTVRPSAVAVATTQDRRTEKAFLASAGIPIAPYCVVEADADLDRAADLAHPAILKTARLGYDGKGQVVIERPEDLRAAWQLLGCRPCVLEQRLTLTAEVSVVLARSSDGHVAAYPPAGNTHADGILDCTVVPVDAPGAAQLAERVAAALDYVGVLAVEMFVVDGRLLVNELAPRPHNSGHWTLDAARTSQFDQQVRVVCGAALGDPSLVVPAVSMVNLLGHLWADGEPDWAVALADPHASLHLYGKAEPRPGRKMGHLTVTAPSVEEAERRAKALRRALIGR